VRFVLEVAWQAHFVKNLFIRPEPEELDNFKPDFVVLNASKLKIPTGRRQELNSEEFYLFTSLKDVDNWGDMVWRLNEKRNLFCMNITCHSREIASMHCSAM